MGYLRIISTDESMELIDESGNKIDGVKALRYGYDKHSKKSYCYVGLEGVGIDVEMTGETRCQSRKSKE